MAADFKFLGDLHLGVIAGAQKGAGLFQIVIIQRFGSAADTAASPGSLQPSIDALAQDIALEFRQRGVIAESVPKRTLRIVPERLLDFWDP